MCNLHNEFRQQAAPVLKAMTSFNDPLKSVPQVSVSETPTAINTVSQQTLIFSFQHYQSLTHSGAAATTVKA